MSDIYLYAADETDFDNIGLCGALMPNEAKFSEIANGNSTLTLTHPRDEYGKFALIERGMILKADVPVRTTPEITNGSYVTTVYEYTVKSTATKEQRKIWNTRDKTKDKRKCLKVAAKGATIVVVKTFENQNYFTKVKYTYAGKKKNKTVTGFIDPAALQGPSVEKTISGTPDGMDAVADSWSVKEQLFRIETVEKSASEVSVTAHHISYDFMYNLTTYTQNGSATLAEALEGVLDGCMEDHPFDAQTNITSTLTGFHYADKDPITALMDPDLGLVPRFDGELVRDNYMFTILDHAGTNRGYRIEYGKNMTGVSWSIDETSFCGAIRPMGEDKNGNKLYLAHSFIANADYTALTEVSGDTKGLVYSPRYYTYSNGTLTSSLPYTRIYALTGDDCKATVKEGDKAEASDITPAMVRTRLKEQALKALKDGSDVPDVSISVDIKQLGSSVQYADFAELEKVFLFDTVLVYHRRMGILADAVVSAIDWDVIQDELTGITLGTIRDLSSSVASWQISQINGGKIMPSTIPGSAVMPGTISAEQIMARTITAEHMSAETGEFVDLVTDNLTATAIHTQMIAATEGTFNDVVTKNLTAADIRAEMISGGKGYFDAVVADNISTAELTAGQITSGTIDAKKIGVTNLDASNIVTGTLNGTDVTVTNLDAGSITSGTIDASVIGVTNLNASNIKTGTLDASLAKITNIDASNISTGTLSANRIAANSLDANTIKASTVATSTLNTVVATIANGKLDNVNATMLYADSSKTEMISTSEGYLNTAIIKNASITGAKIVDLDADSITAGTLSVDRLLIRGGNTTTNKSLIYELNATAEGLTPQQISEEQYRQYLHGTSIMPQTIQGAVYDEEQEAWIYGQIKAGSINAIDIKAGCISTSHVDADFGRSLNLTSNVSVNTLITDADDALRTLISANTNGITALTNGAEGLSQRIDANANGLSVAQTWIDENKGTVENVSGYMEFANGTLTIGKSDNAFKMKLTNDKLSFQQAEAEVAYMDTSKLYINSGQIMKDFRIGNYIFVPQDNNHMSLVFSRA